MLGEIIFSEDDHNVFNMVYFCAWCLKCVKTRSKRWIFLLKKKAMTLILWVSFAPAAALAQDPSQNAGFYDSVMFKLLAIPRPCGHFLQRLRSSRRSQRFWSAVEPGSVPDEMLVVLVGRWPGDRDVGGLDGHSLEGRGPTGPAESNMEPRRTRPVPNPQQWFTHFLESHRCVSVW